MNSSFTGSLCLTERFLGYAGPVGCTELHAHHAIQVVSSLDRPFRLRDAAGRSRQGKAAVVPRDVQHAIVAPAKSVLILYLNPDDATGRRIVELGIGERASAWFAAGRALDGLRFSTASASSEAFEHAVREVERRLVGSAPRPAVIHPAMRRLLASLPQKLDGDVRLASLAQEVGLSPSRLGHLFSETVGISLRPYVLWLRLLRAAAEVRSGGSLTVAAHAAGFTDGAHLSNTFKRMFGLSPSELATSVEWVSPAR